MTEAGTPTGRGGDRSGQAAVERARPALQKEAAGSPERSHPAAAASGDSRTASCTGDPGRRLAHRPSLTHRLRRRRELWGPRSPAIRARYASALCPLFGLVLPASPGPRRDGVGAAPPTRAMGRPLGTEQPPEA